MSTASVLREVREERRRQDAKFPDQRLRLGAGLRTAWLINMLHDARKINDNHETEGNASWVSVLAEEFGEALIEDDVAAVRAELLQVAAVCVRTVENIDAGHLL